MGEQPEGTKPEGTKPERRQEDAGQGTVDTTGSAAGSAAGTAVQVPVAPDPPPPTGEPVAGEPVPPPAEPRKPTPLQMRWVAAVLAVGITADLALRRIPWSNLAFTVTILLAAAGLLLSGFAKTRSSRIMLVGSAVFALFLSWRAGDLLTLFNMASALGLLVGGALLGRQGGIWNLSPLRLLAMGFSVIEQSVMTPIAGVEEGVARYQVATRNGRSGSTQSVLRGIVIALPVVVVLGALLASADVVFRSFFSGINFGLSPLVGHLILIGIGAVAMAALLRLAAAKDHVPILPSRFSLGAIEATVLLGSITVLFAAFTVAQFMTVLGGADDALARAGLDPKQFARQGFFQLLWVTAITLVVVMSVRALTAKVTTGRTVLKSLGLATVALTLVIVAVALTRIFFYIGDSGLTPKRLYAMVITIWIAVSFLLLAVRLIGYKADTAWLTPACLATAIVILATLNVANPNRRIAEDNLERDQQTLVWHVREGQFVGDGRATLAEGLDQLSPQLAADVRELLCQRYGGSSTANPGDDLLSYNQGRNRAANAIATLCG